MRNDALKPSRPPHRRTGKPPGARPGNQQTLKHGLWSAAYVAHRAVVTKAIREANRLAREAR
jgi:hypothetical protein